MPTQGKRSQTLFIRYGEGERTFTDGADASDGVEACPVSAVDFWRTGDILEALPNRALSRPSRKDQGTSL